LKKLTYFIFSR